MNAREFIDALHALETQGDVERLVALYRDDSRTSNPHDDRPHEGRDGARRFWNAYRDSFERIHSEFHNIVENDDVAILEWTSDGRMATGDPVRYDGVSVVEFGDGGIRRFRAYFDPHEVQVKE